MASIPKRDRYFLNLSESLNCARFLRDTLKSLRPASAIKINAMKKILPEAATRSLLNTARMMENNPVLLRLKELEAVERVSEKIEKLTVFDGLDGGMKGLVSLSK